MALGSLLALIVMSGVIAGAPEQSVDNGRTARLGAVAAATTTAATASAPTSSVSVLPLEHYSLRILPLGDSITYGFQSTNGDGYRDVLFNDLLSGNAVDLIGSQHHGTMVDNNNEGHSGYVISQIANVANQSLVENPDVVLLHAGTNDCFESLALAAAPERLGSLIDQILAVVPRTTLLVAQIIGSPNATVQLNIDAFNAQIPGVVAQRAGSGASVMTVDMSHLLDTSTDYADQWHPNDQGYAMMGNAWYQALEGANGRNWLWNATTAAQSATQNGPTVAQSMTQHATTAAQSMTQNATTDTLSVTQNATATAISVTQSPKVTAALPSQLTGGAIPSASAASTAASTVTSTAGAQRLAAVPMAALFALPGHLLSMAAAPTLRQQR